MVADYDNKFPIVNKLSSTTSTAIINHLGKSVFAEDTYGILETITIDNGPQYNSKELKAFCNNWGIEHTRSSPLYPNKGNGFIEISMIQTVKDILRKADASFEDPYLGLLIVNCLHQRSSLTTGNTELPSSGWLQLSVKSDNDLIKCSIANT